VSEGLRRARMEGQSSPLGGSGGSAPECFFSEHPRHISRTTYYWDNIFPGPHDIRWFFGTWFLSMVFYFRLRN
jgi:hypothetical protein